MICLTTLILCFLELFDILTFNQVFSACIKCMIILEIEIYVVC